MSPRGGEQSLFRDVEREGARRAPFSVSQYARSTLLACNVQLVKRRSRCPLTGGRVMAQRPESREMRSWGRGPALGGCMSRTNYRFVRGTRFCTDVGAAARPRHPPVIRLVRYQLARRYRVSNQLSATSWRSLTMRNRQLRARRLILGCMHRCWRAMRLACMQMRSHASTTHNLTTFASAAQRYGTRKPNANRFAGRFV